MTITAAEMQLLRPKPVAATIAWELRLGRRNCCSCSLPMKCGKTSHLLSMQPGWMCRAHLPPETNPLTNHCFYLYIWIHAHVYIYWNIHFYMCVYEHVPMTCTAWFFCNTWQCLHKKGLYKQNSAGKALLNACAFVLANKNMNYPIGVMKI